ncbi:MAG TPA: hypothetical protein EYH03_03140 [Chromatiales bacterium]|nr:hypothetical protein [Chromatiales bacterium]
MLRSEGGLRRLRHGLHYRSIGHHHAVLHDHHCAVVEAMDAVPEGAGAILCITHGAMGTGVDTHHAAVSQTTNPGPTLS